MTGFIRSIKAGLSSLVIELPESRELPWHKQFWPWFLIALPVSVILACLFTVYLAVDNPLSMVKKNYYQEGLTINKNFDEARRAKALGLSARIILKNNVVHVELVSGHLVDLPLILELQFNHPVNDEKDMTLVLKRQTGDSFASEVVSAEHWQWINKEQHWYLRLQSINNGVVDWALEGQSKQITMGVITLSATGS